MLSINELQPGVVIVLNSKPYQVVESRHLKMGRGGGIQQVKLRGLLDNSVLNQNFKGNDSLQEADLVRRQAQYLYCDNTQAHFMDQTTFEQFSLNKDAISKVLEYLPANIVVDVLIYNDKPVAINAPIKVSVKVAHADPGIKGDRSSAGTKAVEIETGASIQAPLFIKTGEQIIIDTRNGSYVERDKR